MNIDQAMHIAKKNNPELHPISCVESRDWFKFAMANGKGQAIGNSCTYAVNKKDGRSGWKLAIGNSEFKGDPDIKYYLSLKNKDFRQEKGDSNE